MNHADPQLEWWALGALLEYDAAALLAAHPLQATDFAAPERALAFRAVESLVRDGKQVTLTAVTILLRGTAAAGLMTAANEAVDARGWGAERFGAVAAELRRLTQCRRMEAHLRESLAALEKPRADPLALRAAAEDFGRSLDLVAPEVERTGADDLLALCDDWAGPERRPTHIPTGIQALDEHCGGWVPNINILAGQPGAMKSGVAVTAAWNQLRAGLSVGYIGLEEGTKFFAKRLVASTLRMSVRDVGRVRLNDYQQGVLQDEAGRIYPHLQRLRVDATANTPARLGHLVRRWIAQGVQCIYLDHGGEVEHEMTVKDRWDLAIRRTLVSLRPLLIRSNVPLVWIHHLNREPGDGRPKKGHLKESGYLEAMGRLILGMWRHERWPERVLIEVMKGNEMETPATLWAKADWPSGLVESMGGGRINWEEIERESREQRRAAGGGWRRGAGGGAGPGAAGTPE